MSSQAAFHGVLSLVSERQCRILFAAKYPINSTNGFYSKISIVHGNPKSKNSQDYAQKPEQNCTFTNLASWQAGFVLKNNEELKKMIRVSAPSLKSPWQQLEQQFHQQQQNTKSSHSNRIAKDISQRHNEYILPIIFSYGVPRF